MATSRPVLLVINYWCKGSHFTIDTEALALAAGCTQHAFSAQTKRASYLPQLLHSHKKLRLLVDRLLKLVPLHVAFLYDLKRRDPPAAAAAAVGAAAAAAAAAAPGAEGACNSCGSTACCLATSGGSTDEPVHLPSGFQHVILSGGNYAANDVDLALLFGRLPPRARLFGICCGFQLLMRRHFDGMKMQKMAEKRAGPRDVSQYFHGWPVSPTAAVFSHRYMAPAPHPSPASVVHDGEIVLGFAFEGGDAGVQYHPECSDETWPLVRSFLQT